MLSIKIVSQKLLKVELKKVKNKVAPHIHLITVGTVGTAELYTNENSLHLIMPDNPEVLGLNEIIKLIAYKNKILKKLYNSEDVMILLCDLNKDNSKKLGSLIIFFNETIPGILKDEEKIFIENETMQTQSALFDRLLMVDNFFSVFSISNNLPSVAAFLLSLQNIDSELKEGAEKYLKNIFPT